MFIVLKLHYLKMVDDLFVELIVIAIVFTVIIIIIIVNDGTVVLRHHLRETDTSHLIHCKKVAVLVLSANLHMFGSY